MSGLNTGYYYQALGMGSLMIFVLPWGCKIRHEIRNKIQREKG